MVLPKYIETVWYGEGKACLKFGPKEFDEVTAVEQKKTRRNNRIRCYISSVYVREYVENSVSSSGEDNYKDASEGCAQNGGTEKENCCPPDVSVDVWEAWKVHWEAWKDIYVGLSWVQKYRKLCTSDYAEWHDSYLRDHPWILPFISDSLECSDDMDPSVSVTGINEDSSPKDVLKDNKSEESAVNGDWTNAKAEDPMVVPLVESDEENRISERKIFSESEEGQENNETDMKKGDTSQPSECVKTDVDREHLDEMYQQHSDQRYWVHLRSFLQSSKVEASEVLDSFFIDRAGMHYVAEKVDENGGMCPDASIIEEDSPEGDISLNDDSGYIELHRLKRKELRKKKSDGKSGKSSEIEGNRNGEENSDSKNSDQTNQDENPSISMLKAEKDFENMCNREKGSHSAIALESEHCSQMTASEVVAKPKEIYADNENGPINSNEDSDISPSRCVNAAHHDCEEESIDDLNGECKFAKKRQQSSEKAQDVEVINEDLSSGMPANKKPRCEFKNDKKQIEDQDQGIDLHPLRTSFSDDAELISEKQSGVHDTQGHTRTKESKKKKKNKRRSRITVFGGVQGLGWALKYIMKGDEGNVSDGQQTKNFINSAGGDIKSPHTSSVNGLCQESNVGYLEINGKGTGIIFEDNAYTSSRVVTFPFSNQADGESSPDDDILEEETVEEEDDDDDAGNKALNKSTVWEMAQTVGRNWKTMLVTCASYLFGAIFPFASEGFQGILNSPVWSLSLPSSLKFFKREIKDSEVKDPRKRKDLEKCYKNLRKWLKPSAQYPPRLSSFGKDMIVREFSSFDDERNIQAVYQGVERSVKEDGTAQIELHTLNLLESYSQHAKTEDEPSWIRTHIVFDADGNPKDITNVNGPLSEDEEDEVDEESLWHDMIAGHHLLKFSYKSEISPPEMPEELHKYWVQRHRLFLKYDEGIKLDHESWYSVTPEMIAAHHAHRCRCDVVVDAFCGAGGNAIQLAMTCSRVIAIDIDPKKIELARHNATVYGVADRIEFIVGDFFQLAPVLKADVVLLSPPWGGVDYINKNVYNVKNLDGTINCEELMAVARSVSRNIALFLPKTSNLYQIIDLAGLGGSVDIEYNYLGNKVKAITAYFSDLVYY